MRFKLRMNPHGQVYLPAVIREDLLEGKTTLELHSNLHAGVLTSADQDAERILDSMKVLMQHFEQISKENKRQMEGGSSEEEPQAK